MPPHVKRAADVIADFGLRLVDSRRDSSAPAGDASSAGASGVERAFLRVVLAGYPDRVAQRRDAGSPNVLMASGTGAVVGPESGVRDGEFLVALDVSRNPPPGRPSHPRPHLRDQDVARVRIASRVEREWLQPTCVGGRPPLRQSERQGAGSDRRSVRRAGVGGASGSRRSRNRGAVDRRRLARPRPARRGHAAAAAVAVRRTRVRHRRGGSDRGLRHPYARRGAPRSRAATGCGSRCWLAMRRRR